MKIAEPELASKARWVISTQLIISVIVAAVFLIKGTWESPVGALYGGLASICISMLLLWGIKRATEAAKENPGKSMRILYVGAAQRFLLVIGLLATGIALFKLDPIAMCVGFALAQLSYLIGSRFKGAA